jgi:hypothetical protein
MRRMIDHLAIDGGVQDWRYPTHHSRHRGHGYCLRAGSRHGYGSRIGVIWPLQGQLKSANYFASLRLLFSESRDFKRRKGFDFRGRTRNLPGGARRDQVAEELIQPPHHGARLPRENINAEDAKKPNLSNPKRTPIKMFSQRVSQENAALMSAHRVWAESLLDSADQCQEQEPPVRSRLQLRPRRNGRPQPPHPPCHGTIKLYPDRTIDRLGKGDCELNQVSIASPARS